MVDMAKMHTRLTRSTTIAANELKRGNIVAFPTETVYGLGANVFDARAVKKIFVAKGRPGDNPLIVHIHDLKQLNELSSHVTPNAKKLMKTFWPGPLTIVLKCTPNVPRVVTAGLSTVGIRMPAHTIARTFLQKAGVPVAAPSANTSGKPSPTAWQHVRADLNEKIPLILQGKASAHGIESTVVDCSKKIPVLLRPGSITVEELEKAVGRIITHVKKGERAASPGMKHKHYTPNATVKLITHPREIPAHTPNCAYIGITPNTRKMLNENPASVKQYARKLFHFFRACDDKGIKTIYAQRVSEKGLGRALMDRLERAEGRKN